jgi:hypothetical protein
MNVAEQKNGFPVIFLDDNLHFLESYLVALAGSVLRDNVTAPSF